MGLIVKKFGGTSVGDLDRIRNVAKLVKAHIDATGDKVAVVASAMSGETNKLIALGKSCVSNPNPRELDALVATGEQVSVALLAMALIDLGVPAKSMSASQVKITTDSRFSNAKIQDIDASRVDEVIKAGFVPVIAGFQGITEGDDVTTLGRGGSDITAVAVAAAIKADSCWIYTDVDGVYSCDPRICKESKFMPQVSHEEMLEMASLGAKVLHPRSVYFAMIYGVPLKVLSTFNPGPGTWIVSEKELMEKPIVRGVTYKIDETKLTVNRIPNKVDSISRIFGALSKSDIFVDMITQTGYSSDTTDISFTVPDDNSEAALRILNQLVPEIGAEAALCNRDVAKISIVGVGMAYHTGVAARMFAALAKDGISLQMISTSEIKISVVVHRKYWELAVRTLHDEFVKDQAKEVVIEKE